MPLWVWLVVLGIVFSAYMTLRANKEEMENELKEAELEGEIIMERIEKEKEKRKRLSEGV